MAVVDQTAHTTQQAGATTERLLAVEQAIEAFAEGGFVVVFDAESRENEGDLMVAAEHTDEQALQQLLDHTSGVVCVALPDERAAELRLPQMVTDNTGLHETAFTVSVDLKEGGTTGISVQERARTIRALADPTTAPDDLCRPGHVFPVRAQPGGVLQRDGHTEAAVDLSLLAGLSGVTTMCEVVKPDWSMARYEDLSRLAASRLMPLISVRDLAAYRLARAARRL
ncbi:3,4-dihydroxy-2-butanone-4-phosphate synthase [Streptomyces sp. LX-29]|uniref:3,4-dihydroxy-2-butanone-4-phosphate synthase n=1 Tax=Streptomyces sp. LX-29 TaxID=2900152 RepID=UPI00240DB581|nr:3,4-dihydroxy-2-butanone-4-phosphate synthase [Streptomyces sp. LX-29]WFB08569.1 3,4-dihydroxy-2-butanone-4-phosphate synthase [Streptomyces sp. LX-29]